MHRFVPIAAAVFSFALAGSVLAQDAGQEAFMEANCNRCHSVETKDIEATITSERMKGPDLSDVSEKHEAEWIVQFVSREVELDGKQHRFPWKGPEEELKTIADWLVSLE